MNRENIVNTDSLINCFISFQKYDWCLTQEDEEK